ncbi:hypothetical protein QN277_016202 [Acacia crassicarpa]|uniref:Uncharacterized protein n=1 Tax=Acacia crassicarpa TaxID=499986 RepID=A0AAE1TBX0_9FABA|nr:hypothetical protein QN277_016202 [Acacia crassicarpa]
MRAEDEFNVACSFKRLRIDGFHKLLNNPGLFTFCGHFGLRGFFSTIQATLILFCSRILRFLDHLCFER